MHRDIKAENILFVNLNYDRVKLIDFGSAKKIEKPDDTLRYILGVTITHAAPEIIKFFKYEALSLGRNHDAGESSKILSEYKKLPGYDKSIDLWSFGIMNYHVLSCQCPWNSLSSEDTIKLYDEISKGIQSYSAFRGIRKDMSEDEFENISDFISNLCHIDNKLRINADEALKHRVFI